MWKYNIYKLWPEQIEETLEQESWHPPIGYEVVTVVTYVDLGQTLITIRKKSE